MSENKLLSFQTTIAGLLSYPHLAEPVHSAFDPSGKPTGKKRFEIQLVKSPADADMVSLKATMERAVRLVMPTIPLAALSSPIRNGDKEADKAKAKGRDSEFMRGKECIVARSEFPVTLSGEENGVVVDYTLGLPIRELALKQKFVLGAKVLARFDINVYGKEDEQGLKGVNLYLTNVHFVAPSEMMRVSTPGSQIFKGHVGQVTNEDPWTAV